MGTRRWAGRYDLELPPSLPRYIPQVDGHDLSAFDAGLGWAAYGVGRRMLSAQTLSIYLKFEGATAREALGLAPGQLAVLVGYSDDPPD